MILCDLPYGTTACKWDSVIPFEPLWEQYKRIITENGVVVLTASQPFTSALVMSNIEMFKYEWIWEKSHATGHLDAHKRPMKQHENICVFASGSVLFNPQYSKKQADKIRKGKVIRANTDCYGSFKNDAERIKPTDVSYPLSIIYQPTPFKGGEAGFHPTQKPIKLMSYLIKTYTNEGMVVLDNCMGSGTTGISCVETRRKFIGIEKEMEYFRTSYNRIKKATEGPTGFLVV